MKLNHIYIYLTFIVIITSCDTSETNANNESLNFPKPSIKEASLLAENPLQCIDQKYPFKTSVVYNSEVDVLPPETVHPSFYGCFDWHSAVHGHWSLIRLIKLFPDLPEAKEIQEKLKKNISKENIKKEVAFFKSENNSTFERTYGWAWIFQLATELKTWEDELAEELLSNMEPLINLLERQTIDFLPKLEHPIRVGEHSNTAFSLSLMFDYSKVFKKHDFEALIKERAISYYKDDQNCPIDWEPSGFDFLSPCLEEARLMAKVLDEPGFKAWIQAFLPELEDEDFYLPYAKVTDRKDGKLVHLDGLNFSRAWCLYELSNKLDKLSHLEAVADFHYIKTFPNLFGDSYEGAHWLGSFAIYTLSKSNKYRFRQ